MATYKNKKISRVNNDINTGYCMLYINVIYSVCIICHIILKQ